MTNEALLNLSFPVSKLEKLNFTELLGRCNPIHLGKCWHSKWLQLSVKGQQSTCSLTQRVCLAPARANSQNSCKAVQLLLGGLLSGSLFVKVLEQIGSEGKGGRRGWRNWVLPCSEETNLREAQEPAYLKRGGSAGPFMGKAQVLPKEQSTPRKVPKIQFHDMQIQRALNTHSYPPSPILEDQQYIHTYMYAHTNTHAHTYTPRIYLKKK